MSATEPQRYATYLDVKFPALSVVDVPALVRACTDQWYNQTLCKVNESVVRLGVMQGEYHWHKHDNDDEFFFVLDGHFVIDLEGRSVDLQPREGFVVPKGVVHRTRAPDRAVILMSREEVLFHVLTHGGYHRGNVGQVLKSVSVAPPRDLYTRFLHQSEPVRREA